MYCKFCTEALQIAVDHPISIEEIDTLLSVEGCPRNANQFFGKTDISVINGDRLEREICALTKCHLSASVDIIYCFNDGHGVKVQFVELKLNSKKGLYTIDKPSFERKFAGSKSRLLASDVVAEECYIIFKDSRIQEAIRLLKRTFPQIDRKFKVKKLSEIVDMHFLSYL